ncbi:MAG: hypothetical protein J5908_11745, partial [Selenomonas sp.]|nr:hypothetical protein [Selenomonas sp.]
MQKVLEHLLLVGGLLVVEVLKTVAMRLDRVDLIKPQKTYRDTQYQDVMAVLAVEVGTVVMVPVVKILVWVAAVALAI